MKKLSQFNFQTLLTRAKKEITQLVESGEVPPESIFSFADLHDFVDANLIGVPDNAVFTQEDVPVLNDLHTALSEWITKGSLMSLK